jgi:hypothetical protein
VRALRTLHLDHLASAGFLCHRRFILPNDVRLALDVRQSEALLREVRHESLAAHRSKRPR